MGLGRVILLVGLRGEVPKAPTILRYLKPKIANSGLFYTRQVTQNESIAASKDIKKDFQLKEKFCYLKNKLTYLNKNSKINFLNSSFLKNHEISFFLLQK